MNTQRHILALECAISASLLVLSAGAVDLTTGRLRVGKIRIDRDAADAAFIRLFTADREADLRWQSCQTAQELKALQDDVREKGVAALGGFPEKCPLDARVTGRFVGKGWRMENVVFQSRPGFHVTANAFIPDDPKFKPPYPAIAITCGHSFEGKNSACYSGAAAQGALNGFVTVIYDPVEQGERHQKRDGAKSWSCVYEHNNIGHRAALLGSSMAAVRIYDGIRTIDYILTREDVDPARVGVMGMSGGGTLSSMINAFDGRVRCAAPAGYLSTIRDVFDNCGPQDAEQHIYGQLAFGLNHLGLMCLRAPSPILMATSHADFFPFIGSTATYDCARRVFATAGKPENVALFHTAGPHHWYPSSKFATMQWMREHLNAEKGVFNPDYTQARRLDIDFSYTPTNSGVAFEPDSVRLCTKKTGWVLTEFPGERSIYDLFREELSAVEKTRVRPTVGRIRELTGIRPVGEIAAAEVPATDGVVLSLDDLTALPVVLARPGEAKGLPPVLIVSDVASRAELKPTIDRFLAEGRSVAIADIRGFGENAGVAKPFYNIKDGDEALAYCLYALGESLVSRRAEDIAVVARYVAKALGSKPVLHAEGRAVVPAAHARFLERDLFAGFESARAPEAWADVVRNDDVIYRLSLIVNGALREYDWTDLLRD